MPSNIRAACFGQSSQCLYTNNIDLVVDGVVVHLYDDVHDLQYGVNEGDVVVHYVTPNQPAKCVPFEQFEYVHIVVIENEKVDYYFHFKHVSTTPIDSLDGLLSSFRTQFERTAELTQTVYIDELTGLTNRKGLFEILSHHLQHNIGFAMLLIDCDNFKVINDGNGHLVGDDYLKQIASRLHTSHGISCRLGGDEFIIVLPTVTHAQAEYLAEDVRINVNQPIVVSGITFSHVGCSVGVVLSKRNSTISELLQQADIAMYVAKRSGGNKVQMFNSDLCQQHYRRVQVIKHISQAHNNKEYTLNIQPIFDCDTHEPVGGEVLLRWNDQNNQTNISPGEFIPLLEQTGEIVRVGKWVICETLRIVHYLLTFEVVRDDFWLSINLSAKQLTQDTVDFLKIQTEHYGLDPKHLHLEITETAMMDTSGYAVDAMNQLRGMGHKIYLDDFGTGYCSLAYIKKLNVDGIKIDRLFITNVHHSAIDHAIVNAIIDIALFLNISVIAEGIEQQETEQYCCSLGCTHLQGMYLCEPLPLDQFILSIDAL